MVDSAPRPPWADIRALFERLLEQPPGERDRALLATAEGGPAEAAVAAEVRALLAQHDAEEADGGGFLQRQRFGLPPGATAAADECTAAGAETDAAGGSAPACTPDRRGQRLGPWELTEPIGRGGMGQVWAARRADGAFEARVAVKLLHGEGAGLAEHPAPGQEQRLLARLNHPHIARLLDAGRADDGKPYFVMEAVDGQPIDQACRGLSLASRLRLFLQLADAVGHAHRQQLVHRDLKPANVLVTADGQVKLLDFGIAQATDLGAAAAAFTPLYASPEQVRGEAVGPASDIYSLGVLLHLLLTGERPYGRGATTALQAAQAVLDEPATLPSVTPRGDDTDPGVERRLLAGDLDAIVQRALAKRPAERYATVEALADDLRAHLALRPVAARRPSFGYVAGRLLRRHRGVVAATLLALLAVAAALAATAWQARDAAAALALAALTLGLGLSTWQARRAALATHEARARLSESHTLVRDIVMRYADTVTYLPGGLQMKADLLKDTLAWLERLAGSAGSDAELAGERAKAYARLADMQLPGLDATLDQPEQALDHGERALALFPVGEPAHRNDPAFYMWWARALRVRQKSQRLAGDPAAALRTLEQAAGLLGTALRRLPHAVDLRAEAGSVYIGIGQAHDTWVEASLGQPDEALAAFAEADRIFRELQALVPDDGHLPYQRGTVAGAMMIVLRKQQRLAEALEQGRRAVALREEALAAQPGNTAYSDGLAGECNNLTDVLLAAGLADEAVAVSARGEAVIAALRAEDPALPTWVARQRWFALQRGRALLAAGQAAEAWPRLQDALGAMVDVAPGPLLRRRGVCQLARARCALALGQPEAARQACAAALADLGTAGVPADDSTAELLAQAQALAVALEST